MEAPKVQRDVADEHLLTEIADLVAEEKRLKAARESGKISNQDEENRLRDLGKALDNCYEILDKRHHGREVSP